MSGMTRYAIAIALALATATALAEEKHYGPGVTDTEIKIGHTLAYSGPASSFGTVGRAAAAYYRMINDQGGVNGRKINFVSLDDAYSPPKAAENVRRLVEQDEVLGIFGSLGTPTNVAMQRYLNDRKVPQFFVFSGVARFRDPRAYPWTMGGDLAFTNETEAFARYILETQATPKIGVLYQNDDFGKDHLAGLRQGLGDRAATAIVKTASYEPTDPTIDSQIIELQQSGANVVLIVAIPKFAAQAIRKVHDIGWNPVKLLAYPGASIPGTFKPAGFDASVGIVTAEFVKVTGDPAWTKDPEMLAFLDFIKKYAPDLDPNDKLTVFGYYNAAMVAALLKQCGDNLTRENLREQATHLKDVPVPMLLPGIVLNTSPNDYSPIKQMQLQRFDGTGWVTIGGLVGG
ncbi:MAG: branched-chain amino acid transport system substrate-binding protein [Acetobacteraceae bacterium]|nr:branched-chain amino acid transport system substrate-binding protein [Acetobacteraceae bacterium]